MTAIPEIDGPGHTSAALASVPNLNCDDHTIAPYSGFGGANLRTYCLSDPQHIANVTAFLTTVMNTVAGMTPGPVIDAGGDEAAEATQAEYSAYVGAVAKAVGDTGKRLMGWHNLAEGPIPAGTLLQYWGDDNDRKTVGTASPSRDIQDVQQGVAKGADYIVSPADRSYLDMQYDTSTPYGLHWEGYVPVERAYDWDPTTATAKPDGTGSVIPADRIEGVEAALWSDRAYYGSNQLPTSTSQFPEQSVYADFMVYPRLPAVAEIGWSPLSTHDWDTFKLRLAAQGPRWNAAGIGYYRAPGVPWPSGS
jgi:hexosaminidase